MQQKLSLTSTCHSLNGDGFHITGLINKTALAESVWGDHIDQADSLDFIYSQMKNLRKKLKDAQAQAELKAVYGFGYKLIYNEIAEDSKL